MTSVSLTPWQTPPSQVWLDGQAVHLWRFCTDLPTMDICGLRTMLCHDELVRADRLLDPLKSNSFVVARGRLRQILSRYLAIPPAGVEFAYGANGKPRLADDANEDLSFNLSHAGCWGLLIIASGIDVGVDIEKIDAKLDYEKVAARFFSPVETTMLRQRQLIRRRRAFYRIWTLKEARLKGEGSGFSTTQTHGQGTEWLLRSFSVDRGYLGALAISGHVTHVNRWDLI